MEEKTMTDLIIRERYAAKIQSYVGKQLIKVITGQRRVGKSYILRQTMAHIRQLDAEAHIIYVDKENMKFADIKAAEDLNRYVHQNTKQGVVNYVFIDEIQEIAQFEKAMRSLLAEECYDLYCTGSNAYMLSSELSTFLAGRYIEIPVTTLSYAEFLQFHQLDDTTQSLQHYLKYGGLPYLKHLALTDEVVFGYLKSVYNTILYRDVVNRNAIRNTVFLEMLILFLADNTGNLFSAKKISDFLKAQQVNITVTQVIAYLGHLAAAFLVRRVGRMDVVGKKLFEIGEKVYFEDLGLRHAVFEYRLTDIGKIMENAVYKHLLYEGFEVKIGQLGQAEVDFVGKRNGEYLYVQVCYLLQDEATVQREFGNLEKISDNYPKMVVSMDEFSGNTHNGIRHVHLREFLKMEF
jgi:predicted AAA+ superfamily ATPase